MEKISGSNLLRHAGAVFKHHNGKLFFCGKTNSNLTAKPLEDITAMPLSLLPTFAMAVGQAFHLECKGNAVYAIRGA